MTEIEEGPPAAPVIGYETYNIVAAQARTNFGQ
jgi:hypothetical protein